MKKIIIGMLVISITAMAQMSAKASNKTYYKPATRTYYQTKTIKSNNQWYKNKIKQLEREKKKLQKKI